MGPTSSSIQPNAKERSLMLRNQRIKVLDFGKIDYSNISEIDLSDNQVKEIIGDLKCINMIILSKNQYKEIPKKVLDFILCSSMLYLVDLCQNMIIKVPKPLICMKTLKKLYLYGNQISEIDLEESHASIIDLGNNHIRALPDISKEIIFLSLDTNFIEEIVVGHPLLNRLNLSHNKIFKIIPKSVSTQLTHLDLSFNSISIVPNLRILFPSLRYLDLSHNQINSIPSLPRGLNQLILCHNCIQALPKGILKLTCMVYVDFSFNLIQKIPSMPCSINTLILNDNLIEEVMHSSFVDLSRLYLMNNRITEIPKIKSSSLTSFFLSNNNITSIKGSVVYNSITSIDLSMNSIIELPESLFLIANLIHLDLSNNLIMILPKTLNQSNLIFLNISGNQDIVLTSFPQSLEELSIASCNLESLCDFLANCVYLHKINASGNKIKSFKTNLHLEYLDLSNNQLEFFPEIGESIKYLNIARNHIKGLPPKMFFPNLNLLDISYNLIERIPEICFSELFYLALQGNTISSVFESKYYPNLDFFSTSSVHVFTGDKNIRITKVPLNMFNQIFFYQNPSLISIRPEYISFKYFHKNQLFMCLFFDQSLNLGNNVFSSIKTFCKSQKNLSMVNFEKTIAYLSSELFHHWGCVLLSRNDQYFAASYNSFCFILVNSDCSFSFYPKKEGFIYCNLPPKGPSIFQLPISKDTCWIIIMSFSAFKSFTQAELHQVFAQNKDTLSILFSLKTTVDAKMIQSTHSMVICEITK